MSTNTVLLVYIVHIITTFVTHTPTKNNIVLSTWNYKKYYCNTSENVQWKLKSFNYSMYLVLSDRHSLNSNSPKMSFYTWSRICTCDFKVGWWPYSKREVRRKGWSIAEPVSTFYRVLCLNISRQAYDYRPINVIFGLKILSVGQ